MKLCGQMMIEAHTRVKDENVMLATLVKLLDELLELVFRVVDGVGGEVQVALHVVDVIPHGVQRNVSLLVVLHNVSQVLHILVSPSALMEPCCT